MSYQRLEEVETEEEQKPLKCAYGTHVSHFRYVKFMPIAACLIFAISCIVPFVICLVSGKKFALKIPTVSESAREFPGSRVFSVGSTIAGLFLALVGWIMTDLPALYAEPLPQNVKVLPVMTGFFFVLVSGFGLDENVFVHLTCALVGFFSLVVFCIFMFAVLSRLPIISVRTLKLVLLCGGTSSLVILALTWAAANVDPFGSIKALAEFCFILFFAMYVATWYKELEDVELIFRME